MITELIPKTVTPLDIATLLVNFNVEFSVNMILQLL